MSVKFGLLALLAEAPTHGYQLKTDFERRTANQWALNIGQVYTTLQRLERDGLVEAIELRWRPPRVPDHRCRTRPARSLVRLAGRPRGTARDELTIKVLLAVAAGDVDVTEVLQRQRTASVEQLQAYTHRKAQADPNSDVAFLIMLDALIFRDRGRDPLAGCHRGPHSPRGSHAKEGDR